MNKEYKEYLKSSEWAEIKIELYKSRGRLCEQCFTKKNIGIYHKHFNNIYNEEPEDLEILCNRCYKLNKDKKKNDK